MKKKILNIILASLTILNLVSCTDLTPEIYSNQTTDNGYKTEADIDAALVGVYAELAPFPGDAWMYYAGYFVMITDYATDMGFSTAAGDPTKMSTMTYDTNNRYFKYNWRTMYRLISNANNLLDNINNVKLPEGKAELVIAQAKFLRALVYRDLTDAWGPVPFVTEAVKNPFGTEDMELTPVAEIEKVIIKDLEECINVLPEKWEGVDLARATKGAAATLLGKIYLRNHDYSNAKKYIDKVLDLRKKGVYTLNPDFKNVWSENNKYDSGSIFCILHEVGLNGGEITNHFGPKDYPDVKNRWQYYAVSLPFWRKYNDLDPRKEFFYYNYAGADKRENSNYGYYYMMPEKGQNTPPNDTTRLLVNVATMKYSYEMVSDAYYDGRTISIFRLSDVILNKAEIENNLNGPAAALTYINEIRKRAGAPAYGEHPDFPVPDSKEAMNNAILDERGYELVFEYKRRPDLIRFGKYEQVVNEHLKALGLAKPVVVTAANKFFPYPLIDEKINSNMVAPNVERIPK